MKYVGIDFGTKRVGTAVSDDSGKIAFPYTVLKNDEHIVDEVLKIVEKEHTGQIVIGESKNFNGEPNSIMKEIEIFVKTLKEKTHLEISFEPEFLTSHQAERWQGKNEMIDASAAAIILQSYLDRLT